MSTIQSREQTGFYNIIGKLGEGPQLDPPRWLFLHKNSVTHTSSEGTTQKFAADTGPSPTMNFNAEDTKIEKNTNKLNFLSYSAKCFMSEYLLLFILFWYLLH